SSDDDRNVGRVRSNVVQQSDTGAIDGGELVLPVAEELAPVRACAPRGCIKDEAGSVGAGELHVGRKVRTERIDAALLVKQRKRRELGQVEAGFEDQPRLHAAVREKEALSQLREHVKTLARQAPSL